VRLVITPARLPEGCLAKSMAIVESDILRVQSSRRWLAWLIAAAALAAVFIALWSSFDSMIAIWLNDSTFAHGFLIPLLSAYALWLKRAELSSAPIRPSAIAVIVLMMTAFAWLIGQIAGVQVLHQFAAAAMIGITVWSVLGNSIAFAALFPLGYLLFMVPFGDFMVPRLMEFTADFTVLALRLTGIPVYREGFFLTTSNGSFEVAEACSGARYLLASLILGTYFAWLEYDSWRRRLFFMLAAFVVPILANGIRAYLVVTVAHFSDMRYGTGQDHIIFGRILFALFMLILFFIGVKFSDRGREQKARVEKRSSSVSSLPGLLAASILTVGIVISVASTAKSTASRSPVMVSALLPAPGPDWTKREDLETGYAPRFRGFDQALAAAYESDGTTVELHEIVYLGDRQDSELVNQQNWLFDPELWRLSTRSRGTLSLADGRAIGVEMSTLYRPGGRLRVHSYYIVGQRWTTSRILAKLFVTYDLLLKRSTPRAFIAVATPLQLGQESAADDILIQFIREHHDRLQLCLSGGNTSDVGCMPADAPARVQ